MRHRNILFFAALVEGGTGLGLMAIPKVVVSLLLGSLVSAEAMPIARVAGFALLALGIACWPAQASAESSRAGRGMLTYNVLVALYLAFLSVVRHVGGVLLWPAVVIHAAVALLLLWTWRNERQKPATTG
jgi:hypothetical protein